MTAPRRIGRYEVVRELGRGGMGVVYEVRDPAVDRRLALKLIGRDADDEALARFRREAELMARVNHPHVVRVHALDVAPEGPFLVTDLVEGEELKAVTHRGALPPDQAARLVRTVADAVEALHAQRILHRDLKPQNVIVRPDGAPVLLDFGIARDLNSRERLTRTGALVGTPTYMAPEQAEGLGPSALGPTVDVHALGAILVEALTGQTPFDEAGGAFSTIKRVMTESPRLPSSLGVAVPHALEAICRVAMAKEPAERYPSAAALRADLDRFLAGEPPRALERYPAPRSRAGPLVGVLVAAVACAGGLLALLARGGRDDPGVAATASASAGRTRRPPTRTAPLPGPTDARPKVVPILEGALLLPHPDEAKDVRGLFIDDDTLVTWGREDGSLRRWSLDAPGEPQAEASLEGWLLDLVVHDGVLFARTPTHVRRIDAGTLKDTVEPWSIPDEPAFGTWEDRRPLAVTSDGDVVVPTTQAVHLLDAAALRPIERLPVGARFPFSAAHARDGWVAAGTGTGGWKDGQRSDLAGEIGYGEVHLWDRRGGRQVRPQGDLPTTVINLAVGPGEPPIVAVGLFSGMLALWSDHERRPELLKGPDAVDTLSGVQGIHELVKAHSGHVHGLAFFPDGTRLLSLSGDYEPDDVKNELRTWSLDGQPLAWKGRLARPPRGAVFSPDGRRLVVGSHRVSDWSGAEVWDLSALEAFLAVRSR